MVRKADTAAKIFSLDPLILYRPQTFRHCLAEAVSDAIDAVPEEFEIADLANPAKLKLLFKTISKSNLILLLAKLLREKGPDILNALKVLPRMLTMKSPPQNCWHSGSWCKRKIF